MARRHTDRAPKRCRRCDQQVLWWRNAHRDGNLCVDLSSDDKGTVRKIVTRDPATGHTVVYGANLTGHDLADAIASDEMLFTLHARTCSAGRQPNPKPAGLRIERPTPTGRK